MNDEPAEHIDTQPSRGEQKRRAEAAQRLGERLIALPQAQLDEMPLPDNLRDAVLLARRIKAHGGLRRQRQYIGKLMRELDTTEIEAAFARLDNQAAQANALLHQAEYWRDRLLAEGDDALASLLGQHPAADRQHLRQLMRNAQREAERGKPPAAARQLFRELRGLLEAEPSGG